MALENSGCSDVCQLFLKDLQLEVQNQQIPIEHRSDYLENKYRFSDEMLHRMVVGE